MLMTRATASVKCRMQVLKGVPKVDALVRRTP